MLRPDLVRLISKIVAALVVLYLAGAAALFALMRQSNVIAGKALALVPGPAFLVLPMETLWCEARKGSLAVGQKAPDFELATRDGKSRVRLSSLRQTKPVVLVFGSYTCPPFRKEMPAINEVYRQYADRLAFYFVYIEEAHASDIWPLKSNAKEKIVFANPADMSERVGLANTCAKSMKIEFPMLVDDMGGSVDRAYTGWPTRIYVVGLDGRIVFKSRPGPFGFEAEPLRAGLVSLLPAPLAATPLPPKGG
jgi:thiol-disulfide isomerase/thioredoxin